MSIKLYKFGPAWGLPDPSPFCLKLESFLRAANIAYEVVPFDLHKTFAKAPKKKVPFIEEEDGTVVGDSTLIIARLSERRGIDLDAPLDERQRAISHGFQRMLDEHVYWVGVYGRWIDDIGWAVARPTLFGRMKPPMSWVVPPLVRRRLDKVLYAQGIGRHSRDEIYAAGLQDMQALSRFLGDDEWFFAAPQPTLLDIWVHAYVAEFIVPPIEIPLKQSILALSNLGAHCQRLQDRLYPG